MAKDFEYNWSNWYYIPIVSLIGYLVYRIIDQSKILYIFPLDNPNDVSAYMAHLFFLKECGILHQCPYWYNGIVTFTTIPPGWFLTALPVYKLTGDILFSTWFIWVLSFVLGFAAIMFFGKIFLLSIRQRLLFFALFYGNALIIGNFVKLMRVHELLALVLLTIVIFMALYYIEHKLDNWSLLFIPLLSMVLITHPAEGILSMLVMGSMFLTVTTSNGKIVMGYILASLLIASPWLVPYILNFKSTIGWGLAITKSLWLFTPEYLPQQIAVVSISIAFILVVYYYIEHSDRIGNDDDVYGWFLILPFFMALLLLFHLTPFIPIFNSVNIDSQLYFLIFLTIFLSFKVIWRQEVYRWFVIGIVLVSLCSICINEYYTPKFREYTQLEYDMLDMFNYIDGKYTYLGTTRLPDTSYVRAYFSYGPIYYNLTTAHGWGLPNKEYNDLLLDSYNKFNERDCIGVWKSLLITNVTYVMTYSAVDCDFMASCDKLGYVKTNNQVCLYKVKANED